MEFDIINGQEGLFNLRGSKLLEKIIKSNYF